MSDLSMHEEHVKWERKNVSTWTPYHENGQVYQVYNSGHDVMPDMLDDIRRRHGAKELLVDEEGNRMTYNQVFDAAMELSRALANTEFSGLERGDRVAVCSKNSFDWVVCYFAVCYAGMIVIPMNSWWTPREIEYAINHAGCKLVFADQERIERIQIIEKCASQVAWITDAPALGDNKLTGVRLIGEYMNVGRSSNLSNRRQEVHPDEPAMIMYTSGTTNFPKGVVLTHRGVCHTCMTNDKLVSRAGPPKGPQGSILLCVPLFHATGLYAILFYSMLAGRKVVIMKKWKVDVALSLIQRERVTHFTGVPTMVLEMLSHPNLKKFDISSLKNIGSGGAPPPAGVAKSVKEKLGAAPSQGYGLTEVNAVATMIGAKDYLQRPTSCGRPAPGVQIKIWSETEDGVELPTGEVGRIVIRGPNVMLEYWKDVEATRAAITKDGWFKCGDYGYLDKDGFLYISGRSQDLIIRGGENISARTVEEAIFALFDSVQECAVFAYPHATLGEEVGLAIFMKEGRAPPTLDEVRSKLKTQVAQFMLPTGMTVFKKTTLPRGATGKTVKKDIKEMLKKGTLENWVTSGPAPAKAKL